MNGGYGVSKSIVPLQKEELQRKVLAFLGDQLGGKNAQLETVRRTRRNTTRSADTLEDTADRLTQEAFQLEKEIAQIELHVREFRRLSMEPQLFVELGALVQVFIQNSGTFQTYFMTPALGGKEFTVGSEQITLITRETRLAKEMIGKCQGDIVSYEWLPDYWCTLTVRNVS